MKEVSQILDAYKAGTLSKDEAVSKLGNAYTVDLGHSTVDLQRAERVGASEVIFGARKTPGQIADIFEALVQREQNVLATHISAEAAAAVQARLQDTIYDELSRTLRFYSHQLPASKTAIAVVCAGTSDLPVSEEAAITAEFYGNAVIRVTDVGVAGIHRLFAKVETIAAARVVIVAAGMEGALPSVVGGLVSAPVIALPTSVGYGASFGGLAALLGMLNSCSSNVTVVNIDNGFGAGYIASIINRS
ncbi:MAG: nickel pincer cofactor biosynthesis protein LarB [Pseudomonadota bacterium]